MARVVVTGGAGFLGSHLCAALLERGDEVVAIDNLVTGSVDNIERLFTEPGFTFVQHDVSNYIWVPGDVDAVMHLASPASPIDFERIPIQILKVGGLGTHNGLGLARAKGAKFFLASTSEVYGDPLVHPQPETYWGNVNPIGPRGVYDEAKRYAEAMTMAYHRHHGIDVRIVRIFNTYGPYMRPDDGRSVSNFLTQALEGKPITVFGDGSQTRSFTYVDDEIRGFLALLDSDVTSPVNIGNPDTQRTILELAQLVIEVTGSSSEIVFEPLPVDDPTQRQPDITKARELLGWGPTIDLRDGLERTAAYFRTKLGLYGQQPTSVSAHVRMADVAVHRRWLSCSDSAVDDGVPPGEGGRVAVVLLEGWRERARRTGVVAQAAHRGDEAVDVALAEAEAARRLDDRFVDVAALRADVEDR